MSKISLKPIVDRAIHRLNSTLEHELSYSELETIEEIETYKKTILKLIINKLNYNELQKTS